MKALYGSLIIKLLIFLLFLSVLIFGFKPFKDSVDAEITLIEEADSYVSETRRLFDGSYLVAVRTPMPSVKAGMVRWWFADFLNTTEHYNWWHPTDHVWMDWENKIPGKIIGASHLVHEYIGGEISKLRIQFVDPSEFFGHNPNDQNTFVICAIVGLLDKEINIAKMCHVVTNNNNGSEMRSRFWLGHISTRKGEKNISSLTAFLGNMAITRFFALDKEQAEDLKLHAEEEMRYLADLLVTIYNKQKN